MRRALTKEVSELVGSVSLFAAVLGVLGAFLGWRVDSAYLLCFGLDPVWSGSELIRLIVTAWVEILLVLAMAALFIFIWEAIGRYRGTVSLRSFALCLIAVSTFLFIVLSYYMFLVTTGRITFFSYALLGLVSLLAWSTLVAIGVRCFGARHIAYKGATSKLHSVLFVLFSSPMVFLLLTVVFTGYYVINFAGARGTYIGERDKSARSRRPYVSLISNTPLIIPSGQKLPNTESSVPLYLYADLRLLGKIGDSIVVFNPGEIDPVTGAAQVYSVPSKSVDSMQIRQWYWPTPVPTPSGTVTPSFTPTASP